jgi:uncharacterized protein (TIGR03435 family)
MTREILCAAFCTAVALAAPDPPAFEVASVKPSKTLVGHDGNITIEPGKLTVRNATLKRLIFEAYQVPYPQITGGPPWLDQTEFDINAKAEGPATSEQLKLMLRTLLTDRFKLALRTESKERRVYVLTVGKGGAKLPGSGGGDHPFRFHGNLTQFAGVLAFSLTTPLLDDPTVVSHSRGDPTPVLDKTGIAGVYDISIELKPEPGADPFTVWQRALQEQLGLKLESKKAAIDFLIIDHAEKIPTEN